jgi:hypothetical protein
LRISLTVRGESRPAIRFNLNSASLTTVPISLLYSWENAGTLSNLLKIANLVSLMLSLGRKNFSIEAGYEYLSRMKVSDEFEILQFLKVRLLEHDHDLHYILAADLLLSFRMINIVEPLKILDALVEERPLGLELLLHNYILFEITCEVGDELRKDLFSSSQEAVP